jgi:WXG100 family type VII secretion target
MATGAESVIDTRLFTATADSIGAAAKELEQCFSDWARAFQGLRGNWQGSSSDNIKNTTDSVQKSAAELLRSLGGYKAALYEIAGIYDKTEKAVSETSKSLKFDKPMR